MNTVTFFVEQSNEVFISYLKVTIKSCSRLIVSDLKIKTPTISCQGFVLNSNSSHLLEL